MLVLFPFFILILLCVAGLIMGITEDWAILTACIASFLIGAIIGLALILITQIAWHGKRKRKGFSGPAQMISRRDTNMADYMRHKEPMDIDKDNQFKSE